MGKIAQWIGTGCLVFLCLVVLWEILASSLYRSDIEKKIRVSEAVNGAYGNYKTETERLEEIRAELEVRGNPYSLFR